MFERSSRRRIGGTAVAHMGLVLLKGSSCYKEVFPLGFHKAVAEKILQIKLN